MRVDDVASGRAEVERELPALGELFHENTKLTPTVQAFLEKRGCHEDPVAKRNAEVAEQAIREGEILCAGFPKRYETATTVRLPRCDEPQGRDLYRILEMRESVRSYRPGALSIGKLGTVLQYAYGNTRSRGDEELPRKYVPSSGALYPLELYVAWVEPEEAQWQGVYHYYPPHHALEFIGNDVSEDALRDILVQPELLSNCVAVLFVTGLLGRLVWKYGERSYRYLLLEAGHVGQNISLVCAGLGLGVCPVGGFLDDFANDYLRIDGVAEFVVYLLTIGWPELA